MTSTETAPGVDTDVNVLESHSTTDDPSKNAHYVNGKRFNIAQARANGTPVVALCGYRWVPMNINPALPVCPKCMDLATFVCKP